MFVICFLSTECKFTLLCTSFNCSCILSLLLLFYLQMLFWRPIRQRRKSSSKKLSRTGSGLQNSGEIDKMKKRERNNTNETKVDQGKLECVIRSCLTLIQIYIVNINILVVTGVTSVSSPRVAVELFFFGTSIDNFDFNF